MNIILWILILLAILNAVYIGTVFVYSLVKERVNK